MGGALLFIKKKLKSKEFKNQAREIYVEYFSYGINFLINISIIFLFSIEEYSVYANGLIKTTVISGLLIAPIDNVLYSNLLQKKNQISIFLLSLRTKIILGSVFFFTASFIIKLDKEFLIYGFISAINIPLFYRALNKFRIYILIQLLINIMYLIVFVYMVIISRISETFMALLIGKHLLSFSICSLLYWVKSNKRDIRIKPPKYDIVKHLIMSIKTVPNLVIGVYFINYLEPINLSIYKIIVDYAKYSKELLTPIYHFILKKIDKNSFEDYKEKTKKMITIFNPLFGASSLLIISIILLRYGQNLITLNVLGSIFLIYLTFRIKIKTDTKILLFFLGKRTAINIFLFVVLAFPIAMLVQIKTSSLINIFVFSFIFETFLNKQISNEKHP